MAKLIPFSAQYFEDLPSEERYATQRLVYQLKFQEGVKRLRAKYGLPDSAESPRIIEQDEVERILSKEPPNNALEDELVELLSDVGYNDQARWLSFAFLLTVHNAMKKVALRASADIDYRAITEGVETRYAEVDRLFEQGKDAEAEKLLSRIDTTVYESQNVVVNTSYRNFIVGISSNVERDDLDSMCDAIMKAKLAFTKSRKKTGRNDDKTLDMLNDIAEWKRQGRSHQEIDILLGENGYYRRNISSMGQMIRRATKELGF
ncbi:MAG: hypothetical protein WC353_02975 [Candidatus Peribacter sp.]|jgi:hypothetical protein